LLSCKFRLYLSKQTEKALLQHLDLCRWLYNRLLEELNRAKAEGREQSQKDTQALIVKLKTEKPELEQVYSKVLQMINYQLWSNIRALSVLKKNGRRVGKLRFKGQWFKTLNFNQSGFRIEGKKLFLSKVGAINIKLHRPIEGKIKGVFVKRGVSEKWHAIFQVENTSNPLPGTGKSVGIDVGLRHFLTDSDGRQVENPKFYGKTLGKIKVLQYWLSRKKKGSRNREKQRVKLAETHEKLENQRNDFLHKLSRFYVNNYDTIYVENLNIKGMARNHNLAQKILDVSWGKFFQMLSYKAESADRTVVEVNPRGTSEGLSYDNPLRDYISANRIKMRGRDDPKMPAEMRPPRELIEVPASLVVEAGSPFRQGGVVHNAPPLNLLGTGRSL